MIDQRLLKLRKLMEPEGLESLMVTDLLNIYYLSGFTGEGTLLITTDEQHLVTDRRFTEQARVEAGDFQVHDVLNTHWYTLTASQKKVGFESAHITCQRFQNLVGTLGDKLQATNNLVEKLRVVKDDQEIAAIRRAVEIGDEVFQDLLPEIRPGVSEKSLANFIEYRLKQRGCDREAFETIAVSGQRSSLPHGHPSDKTLEIGDLLTLDFGGIYHKYAGDMTRTLAVRKSCPRIRSIYSQVLEAQMEGVEMVASGRTCSEVDRAVRDVFERYGLLQYFAHSTGHGVGLGVHEAPSVSQRDETILSDNMVITIEPGLYIPGWGGVRIEDVVLVKGSGHEVLTGTTKDLLII